MLSTSLFLATFGLLSVLSCSADAKNCGNVRVCLTRRTKDSYDVSLRMTIDPTALGAPLADVDASGYYVNLGTAVNGPLSIPGNAPVLAAPKKYTDKWNSIKPGDGTVKIGFPALRAFDATGNLCYGVFERDFTVSASASPTQCGETAMFVSTKVDFALVLDNTGSMRDDIDAAKLRANEIVDALNSASTSFRAAIITYNDPGAEYVQQLTSSVSTFKSKLNSVKVSGGGDYPECVYDGLSLALGLGWDESAKRIIITMGDAPAKKCEDSLADVLLESSFLEVTIDLSPSTPVTPVVGRFASIRKSVPRTLKIKVPTKKRNPLKMVSTTSFMPRTFKTLAEKTGGETFDAKKPEDVVPTIVEAITGKRPGATPKPTTKDLIVEKRCPAVINTHYFTIINPNSFTVKINFRELRSRSKGERIMRPGRNNLMIKGRPNQRRILLTVSWTKMSGERKTKILRTKVCPNRFEYS